MGQGLDHAHDWIYDALLDDGALDRLTGRLAEMLGAHTGWFPLLDEATGSMRLMAPYNVPAAAVRAYAEHYHRQDPWLAAALTRPVDTAIRLEQMVTPEAFKQLEMYNEYVRPNFGPITFCMGARIPLGDRTAFIGLHRTDEQGPFSDEAELALQRLLPPLRRLLAVRLRLEGFAMRGDSMEATLDGLAFGVVRCDSQSRIVYANRAALAMMRRQDGLRGMPGGRIGAIERNESAALARLILASAAETGSAGGAVQIRRVGGRPAYHVTIAPFRRAGAEPASLLLIDDPDQADPGLAQALAGLYGFSEPESDLAIAFMNGISIEEFAEMRDLSPDTVRGRVKRLFGKVGVSGQQELLATLSRIPVAMRRKESSR